MIYVKVRQNGSRRAILSTIAMVAFFVGVISSDCFLIPEGRVWAAEKTLNVKTFTIPGNLGRVKESWGPAGTSRTSPIVIQIQDAHCNYDAQKKIAEIVEYLNKEYGISVVNLEGGAEDYDISIFTNIADNYKREKVSDYFVREGLVNGAEYFAINNPGRIMLWGVEDTGLYLSNLDVYRKSLRHKDEIGKSLKSLSYILANLKVKIYSNQLLEFDRKYSQYKANNIEFKEYLNYILDAAKARGIDIKPFRNISLLNQALREEAFVDFNKANNERDLLIEILHKKLSKNAIEELAARAIDFKAEKISQKDFYGYLLDKAGKVKIDSANFGELEKYTAYISTYDAIDKMKVMDEIDDLETKIKGAMFENSAQRDLSTLSKNLALLKNIFNISLTRDDYRYYKANEGAFAIDNFTRFIKRQAPLVLQPSLRANEVSEEISKSGFDRYREEIAKFYEYSFKRDEAFIKNIKFNDRYPARNTIIITGGFHTDNLCGLLRKEGIPYISIIPSFKNPAGYECPYFNILSGEKGMKIIEALPSVLNKTLATPDELNPVIQKAYDEYNKTGAVPSTGESDIILSGGMNTAQLALREHVAAVTNRLKLGVPFMAKTESPANCRSLARADMSQIIADELLELSPREQKEVIVALLNFAFELSGRDRNGVYGALVENFSLIAGKPYNGTPIEELASIIVNDLSVKAMKAILPEKLNINQDLSYSEYISVLSKSEQYLSVNRGGVSGRIAAFKANFESENNGRKPAPEDLENFYASDTTVKAYFDNYVMAQECRIMMRRISVEFAKDYAPGTYRTVVTVAEGTVTVAEYSESGTIASTTRRVGDGESVTVVARVGEGTVLIRASTKTAVAYAPGMYRTTVIVSEGIVSVRTYDENGVAIGEEVFLTPGQNASISGKVEDSSSAAYRKELGEKGAALKAISEPGAVTTSVYLKELDRIVSEVPEINTKSISKLRESIAMNSADKDNIESVLAALRYITGVIKAARPVMRGIGPDGKKFVLIPISEKLCPANSILVKSKFQKLWSVVRDEMESAYKMGNVTLLFYDGTLGEADKKLTSLAPDGTNQGNTVVYIDAMTNEDMTDKLYKNIMSRAYTIRDTAGENGGYLSVAGHVVFALGALEILNPDTEGANDPMYFTQILSLMQRISPDAKDYTANKDEFLNDLKNGRLTLRLPPISKIDIDGNMETYFTAEAAATTSL